MLCENCQLEIQETRTQRQNRYFYAIVGILAKEIGYTPAAMKCLIKKEFNMYDEIVNKKTGEILIDYHSTADLSKKAFSELTEDLLDFANSNGVRIYTPEEFYEKRNEKYFKNLNNKK